MTLEDATKAAEYEAKLFGMAMSVYRFVAWPEGVWGVRMKKKLTKEAVVAVTFESEESTEETTIAEPAGTKDDEQGSLF